MNLFDAIRASLTGSARPPTVGGGRPPIDALRAFQEWAGGSQRKAAKELGVSLSTWQRWLAGATPRAKGQAQWQAAQQRAYDATQAAYTRAMKQAIRDGRRRLVLVAKGEFLSGEEKTDERKRRMHLGQHSPTIGTKVLDAYEAGNEDAAARAIQRCVANEYGARGLLVNFDEVEAVEWE